MLKTNERIEKYKDLSQEELTEIKEHRGFFMVSDQDLKARIELSNLIEKVGKSADFINLRNYLEKEYVPEIMATSGKLISVPQQKMNLVNKASLISDSFGLLDSLYQTGLDSKKELEERLKDIELEKKHKQEMQEKKAKDNAELAQRKSEQ